MSLSLKFGQIARLAVLLVLLGSAIDPCLAFGEEAVDDTGQVACHRLNCFGAAKPGSSVTYSSYVHASEALLWRRWHQGAAGTTVATEDSAAARSQAPQLLRGFVEQNPRVACHSVPHGTPGLSEFLEKM